MEEQYTSKYHLAIRILHWSMAIIILCMIVAGWYMEGLEKSDSSRDTIVALHKSFGTLILILFFARLSFRIFTKVPPLPKTIPTFQRFLADMGHRLLYVFILIVPLSGYAMSNFYGYSVKMFGVNMPHLFAANREYGGLARQAHEILPYVFLAFIALHIIAVIQHRFFDKPENDVLKRMT